MIWSYVYIYIYNLIYTHTLQRSVFILILLLWLNSICPEKKHSPPQEHSTPPWSLYIFLMSGSSEYASHTFIKFIRIFRELCRKILLNTYYSYYSIWGLTVWPLDPALLTRCFWWKSVGCPGRAGKSLDSKLRMGPASHLISMSQSICFEKMYLFPSWAAGSYHRVLS